MRVYYSLVPCSCRCRAAPAASPPPRTPAAEYVLENSFQLLVPDGTGAMPIKASKTRGKSLVQSPGGI